MATNWCLVRRIGIDCHDHVPIDACVLSLTAFVFHDDCCGTGHLGSFCLVLVLARQNSLLFLPHLDHSAMIFSANV